MGKALQNWSSKELIIVVLLAVIAVGIIFIGLIAANIIPITKTITTQQPTVGPGGTTTTPATTPSTNQTQPFKGEQRAGTDIGSPVVNPVTNQQLGVKCPPSCCLKAVTGTGKCSGSNQTYYEQECYSYPSYANSVIDCENQKTTYYVKCGACPQASCPTALC